MTTAHASSSVTVFMRSRIASGTFGRPSGKRSPFQSGVYSTSCCLVSTPGCAHASGAMVSRKAMAKNDLRMLFLVRDGVSPIVTFAVLEPIEVGGLRRAGQILARHADE